MSSPETLLKASINRLITRLMEKLLKKAADIADIAKDAPEKLQKEWGVFQEEVVAEAARLDKQAEKEKAERATNSQNTGKEDPQQQIDLLRNKVSALSRKIEGKS